MKIGDYVRTINGIVKIKEITNNVMRDEDDRLHYGDFIESNPNIIDLIEVGDYVNGHLVIDKNPNAIYIEDSQNKLAHIPYTKENIKSIVTHEQFDAMKYEVK